MAAILAIDLGKFNTVFWYDGLTKIDLPEKPPTTVHGNGTH
jgi:hypothetical protein